MTREEAQAIYRAGEETVVRVLVELSARVDQLTTDFALLKAENIALRERVRTLEGQLAKDSHNSVSVARSTTCRR
jgi:cell division protein FtsB